MPLNYVARLWYITTLTYLQTSPLAPLLLWLHTTTAWRQSLRTLQNPERSSAHPVASHLVYMFFQCRRAGFKASKLSLNQSGCHLSALPSTLSAELVSGPPFVYLSTASIWPPCCYPIKHLISKTFSQGRSIVSFLASSATSNLPARECAWWCMFLLLETRIFALRSWPPTAPLFTTAAEHHFLSHGNAVCLHLLPRVIFLLEPSVADGSFLCSQECQ